MFEENVNTIVEQTNDQLDILKVYIDYRVRFWTERVFNRFKVLSRVGDFPGKLEFNDVGPVKFDVLKNAYVAGLKKEAVIAAAQLSIKELDDSIKILMK